MNRRVTDDLAGIAAAKMLLEQLSFIERSTRERLSVLAMAGRPNQAANGKSRISGLGKKPSEERA